ncbi:Os09g0337300, partial [Oryza sativa Japonica Group]
IHPSDRVAHVSLSLLLSRLSLSPPSIPLSLSLSAARRWPVEVGVAVAGNGAPSPPPDLAGGEVVDLGDGRAVVRWRRLRRPRPPLRQIRPERRQRTSAEAAQRLAADLGGGGWRRPCPPLR